MPALTNDEIRALLDDATPGPWKAKRAPHGPIDIFDHREMDIVTVYGGGVELEHKAGNARLIAAAPDAFAEVLRLREVLREADLQLAYLDERQPTGTTPSIRARIAAALKGAAE